MTKECILYEGKYCDNCGECNICDLDPKKLCDNCGKCLEENAKEEFRSVVYKRELTDEEIDEQSYNAEPDEEDPEQALLNAFLDLPIDLEVPEPIEVDPALAAEWESILANEMLDDEPADAPSREIGIRGVRKRRNRVKH